MSTTPHTSGFETPIFEELPGSIQRNILEHISTAILVFDEQLQLCFINPAAESALALSRQRILGMNMTSILAEEGSDTLEGVHKALTHGHCYSKREAVLALVNGRTLTVDYMITPIFEYDSPDKNTHKILMEFQLQDRLSKIHQGEHQHAKQETARILVRGLAHEIKNPLGGLRGAAQLLELELESVPRADELKEYTGIIIKEADRLRNLVDSMLGPNRPPQLVNTNIHEILERVCNLIHAETGGKLSITRDYDPSIPELAIDTELMIQATLNIIRNAMQAINQHMSLARGKITLRTRILRQFTIGSVRHRIICRLDIEDNGPGIGKEMLDKIFYPMISGRPEGSGLGLSIAQSILSQHEGIITCESQPGRTCFSLLIPLQSQQTSISQPLPTLSPACAGVEA